MNFILEACLFASDKPPLDLFTLVGFASLGRHRIEVPPEAQVSFIAWADSLGTASSDVLQTEALSAQENARSPCEINVTVQSENATRWSDLDLTTSDAVELAAKPVRIFLENGHSDRAFLLAFCTSQERKRLEDMAEKEWLEFEGCGGINELQKRVNWALKHESRSIRCAALYDGDSVDIALSSPESDGAFRKRLGKTNRQILERLESFPPGSLFGLVFHVLERRAIENYIPDTALTRWAKRSGGQKRATRLSQVNMLAKLTERNHYNMKDGFVGDRRRSPPVKWLPCDQSSALEEGFGSKVYRVLHQMESRELDTAARNELAPFLCSLFRRLE